MNTKKNNLKILILSISSILPSIVAIDAYADRPPIVWMRGGHNEYIAGLKFFKNRNKFASIGGANDGTAKIFDAKTSKLLLTLHPFDEVSALAISSNGKLIAIGGYHNGPNNPIPGIKIFDAVTGSLKNTIQTTVGVSDLDFSPDSKLLASAGADGGRIWKVLNGAMVSDLSYVMYQQTNRDLGEASIAFSPNEPIVATNRLNSGNLVLYNYLTHSIINEFLDGGGYSIKFSPNGQMIASSTGVFKVMDAYHPNEFFQLLHFPASTTSVAFSPESDSVAATGINPVYLNIWKTSDGSSSQHISDPDDHVGFGYGFVAFSPDTGDSQKLVYGRSALKLWQASNGNLLSNINAHTTRVNAVSFSADGKLFASVAANGNNLLNHLRIWNSSNGALVRDIPLGTYNGKSVTFSPDNKTVAVSVDTYADSNIQIYNISDGILKNTLKSYASGIAFSHNGKGDTLATVGQGAIKLWNLSTDNVTLIGTYSSYENFDVAQQVAFTPKDKTLITGGGGAHVQAWNIAKGILIRDYTPSADTSGDYVYSMALSPDGKTIAAGIQEGSGTHQISLWQVSDGKLLKKIEGPQGAILSVAFSADSSMVLGSSKDQTLRIWRVSDGAPLAIYDQEIDSSDNSRAPVVIYSPTGLYFGYGRPDATVVLATNPFSLKSFTLTPNSAVGSCQSFQGTITLAGPAPTGGAEIKITGNNPGANFPASVIVPAGGTNAEFTITSKSVIGETKGYITASYGGVRRAVNLAIEPGC